MTKWRGPILALAVHAGLGVPAAMAERPDSTAAVVARPRPLAQAPT